MKKIIKHYPMTDRLIVRRGYVISLSNMSIKTNFKHITRFELKLTNLYNTLKETTCMTSRYLLPYIHQCVVTVGSLSASYSNNITSWKNSSAEKISCNVAPFFYHHSVVITTLWWYNILQQTSCIRQATFFNFKGKNA